MNYNKIYNTLCESRKYRGWKRKAGYEVHHILPKSLGGSDSKENLVRLTAREHFIAHKLLARMFPDNYLMVLSLQYFLKHRDVINSRDYQRIKDNIRKYQNFLDYIRHSVRLQGKVSIGDCWDQNCSKGYHRVLNVFIENVNSVCTTDYQRKIITRLAILCVILKRCGYYGIYNYSSKYSLNKYKEKLIKAGVIDRDGYFIDGFDCNIPDNFLINLKTFCKRYLLKSEVKNRGIGWKILQDLVIEWVECNPDKMLTLTVTRKGYVIIKPITPFLPKDYPYQLKLFKEISYKEAEIILKDLIDKKF